MVFDFFGNLPKMSIQIRVKIANTGKKSKNLVRITAGGTPVSTNTSKNVQSSKIGF
jgi:hypothetical protein